MRIFRKIMFLPVMALAMTGCNLDEQAECPALTAVTVRAAVKPGLEIDEDDIKTVALYIFDRDEHFLERIDAVVGQRVVLDYPDAGNLHVVAVGNAGVNEILSDFGADNLLSEGLITLRPETTRAGEPVHQEPSDLFYGREMLVNDRVTEEEKELPMSRVVAQMVVRAIELKEFAMTDDWDFHYEVVSNFSGVDFGGGPTGEPVVHKIENRDCEQVGNVFFSPTFNLISSEAGHPVTVRIWHGSTLVDEISKDKEGKPLVAVNGKLLNVTIDYSGRHINDGHLSVTIEYSGWGEPIEIGKIF